MGTWRITAGAYGIIVGAIYRVLSALQNLRARTIRKRKPAKGRISAQAQWWLLVVVVDWKIRGAYVIVESLENVDKP